jgi:hypothetical protein
MGHSTVHFMQSVPRTPVRQHIEYLHQMAYLGGIYGDALSVFEHHLYAIAVATAEPPVYGSAVVPPPPPFTIRIKTKKTGA